MFPGRPFIVNVPGGKLELARSSASAGVYVNRGGSDPDLAELFRSSSSREWLPSTAAAHIGEYTLLFSVGVGKHGRVHSFEPHPNSFRILSRNVALNDLQNVTLNQIAVADGDGSGRLVLDVDPTMSALATSGNEPSTISVEVVSLDSYAESERLDRVDVLKIDVEGAEALVVAGASAVLTQLRPAHVFVECHSSEARDAVNELFRSYGYEPVVDDAHMHAHVWARPSLNAPRQTPLTPQ